MYQIPKLSQFPKLKHVFSTVDEGNMAGWMLGVEKDKKSVSENRKKFLNKAEVDIEKCVCMRVVHGSDVALADPKSAGISMIDFKKAVTCDAIITDKNDLFLFLLIADCLPIILYNPTRNLTGLVHAGWRGAEAQVAKEAVDKLDKEFSSNSKDLIVGFGPAARVPEYYKDFVGDCRKQLITAGVSDKNIFDCGINTIVDKRFFSYRRDVVNGDEDKGRFACVVGLN